MENKVSEFHTKYGLPIDLTNNEILGLDDLTVRENLISEEYDEVMEAIMHLGEAMNDPIGYTDAYSLELLHANVLKELCDLVYVVIGTAVSWQYDFTEAFNTVHASNMTKDGGIIDGKMTKGEAYIPADVRINVGTRTEDDYDIWEPDEEEENVDFDEESPIDDFLSSNLARDTLSAAILKDYK